MAQLRKNAEVLRYLLEVAPGVGHTLLAKFAYLADLIAREHLGRPITNMRYRYDNYGPFDAVAFYRARDELLEAGLISHAPTSFGSLPGFEMQPSKHAVDYSLGPAEREILTWVARKYGSWTATDLCNQVVYASKPMQGAKPGDRLDMDQMNREPEELGFDLERMLEGEKSAEEGRVRPLADVLDELRSRNRA